jgi:ParB family chromosome partitioning protein
MQEFKMISVEDIDLPPLSLRTDVSQESLKELSESLETEGLIQPILLRPKEGRYELVVGERRVRAAIYANVPKIPAIIRDISDEEASRLRLIENINRRDLEIWETVDGIKAHMKMYGLTLEQMADKLHITPETLGRWFTLAERTAPKIKSSPELRKLPPAYLMSLTKYDDKTQERFARAILSKELGKYQILKLTGLFDQDPRADIDELARLVKEGYAEIVTLVPKEEAEKIKRKRAKERKKEKTMVKKEALEKHLRPREPKEEKPEEEKAPVVREMPKELQELSLPFTMKEQIMDLTEFADAQVRIGKAIVEHKFDLKETGLFFEKFKDEYPKKTLDELVEEVKAISEEWKMERPIIMTFKPTLYKLMEAYYKKKNKEVKEVTVDRIREVAIEWLDEHSKKVCTGEAC